MFQPSIWAFSVVGLPSCELTGIALVRKRALEIIVEASSAQEAFKLVGNVDAAFLDLKMPGISGIEFLRETKPMAPVIVLTAFADSSNTIEAIKLGAFDHLTKPIGRSDLQPVLAEALKNPQSTPGGDSPPSGDELIGWIQLWDARGTSKWR
jgi:two-component system, NtrC family, response regulator